MDEKSVIDTLGHLQCAEHSHVGCVVLYSVCSSLLQAHNAVVLISLPR